MTSPVDPIADGGRPIVGGDAIVGVGGGPIVGGDVIVGGDAIVGGGPRPMAGDGKIVLVRERPAAAARTTAAVRRPSGATARAVRAGQRGWTVRRLTIGGALGGAAALVGGLLFAENFTLLTGSRGPLLAIGFGLFVVGVAVFCGCLVGLTGYGIAALVRRHGWPRTASMIGAAVGLLCLLWAVGLFGAAVPGVFALVVIGAVLVAMTR